MVSKHRQARMQHLATYLLQDQVQVDIIGLQEIWLRQDYIQLCEQLKSKFPYAYYFRRLSLLFITNWTDHLILHLFVFM
jgi:hypothetical protein